MCDFPCPPSPDPSLPPFSPPPSLQFVIYLSSLIRAVVALHGVVQNKIDFQEMEEGGKEGGKEGGRDGGKEGRTEGGKTEEGKENGEKKGASGEKGKGGKK
jgi:hypothetical protein